MSNIFDYAMKMEEDGKAMYEKLAEKASTDEVRRIFTMMADDEQKHFETFKAMKENPAFESMADSKALDGTKNVFKDLGAMRKELKNLEGDLPVYTKAMEIEGQSAQLYREAAGRETDKKVKAILEQIAQEEEKHYSILENLYLYASAPTQYMEWQEFTSADTFEGYTRRPED